MAGSRMLWCAAVAVVLARPVSAAPQDPAPDCGAEAVLPAEFAAWPKRHRVEAGTDLATAGAAGVSAGQAVVAVLKPAATLRYVAVPGKAGAPGSFGGIFAVTIPRSGTYRVALGSRGWVDVIQGEKAAASSAHGHGPACSGIRKIVDFPLQAGRHVLQIAGADVAELPILVIPAR